MGGIIVPAPPVMTAVPASPGSGGGSKKHKQHVPKSFGGPTVTPKDPFNGFNFPNAAPGHGSSSGGGGGHHGGGSSGGGGGGGGGSDFLPGAPIDGGSAGLSIPGFEEVGKLIHYLGDAEFWKLVGIGLLGFVLVLLSVALIISSSKTAQKVVSTGTKVASLA